MALSWIFDLQLGMARLFGQLCSAALDSRKGRYNRPGKQSPFPVKALGGNQCCYYIHEDKVGLSIQDNPHLSLHKIGSAASKMANMMNRVKLLFFCLSYSKAG